MFMLYYSEGCNICGEVLLCVLHQRLVHYNMQWCAGSPHYAPDRVDQLVPEHVATPEVAELDDLDGTARGDGGFGSTGV